MNGPTSWRDKIKVHPAADLFPMMSQAELQELAHDIREHGLRRGVVFWTPESVESSISRKPPEEIYLLDGRNRLAALELACKDEEERIEAIQNAIYIDPEQSGFASLLYADVDPYAYVISANIRRRHLTAEQKREIIAELLKQRPERSDRAIAKIVGASPTHVGKTRKEEEAAGKVSTVDTRVGSDGVAQPATKPSAAVRAEAERREEIPHVETRTDTAGRQQPARKKAAPRPAARPSPPAAQARDKAVAGFSALLHQQLEKTLEDLAKLLGGQGERIREIPKQKRIVLARAYLDALGVAPDDLGDEGAR
jgi:hypothetical protein